MSSRFNLLLASMLSGFIGGCTMEPEGPVARVEGVVAEKASGVAQISLLDSARKVAEKRGLTFIVSIGRFVDGRRDKVCESIEPTQKTRSGWGVSKLPPRVPINPNATIRYALEHGKLVVWVDGSPVKMICEAPSPGTDFSIALLFSYEPTTMWGDNDELEPLNLELHSR
jgi:hypothetical protein